MILELILVVIPLIAVGALRPRWFFHLFFTWLLLEGILRKWIFPGLATPLFFIKYILIIGPMVPMIISGVRLEKGQYPYLLTLLLYLVWGIFEMLNFRATGDLRIKLLGMIIHFSFIPFLILVPRIINNRRRLEGLFELLAYSSIPIFLLGVYQHFAGQGSALNVYVGEGKSIAIVGDFVRITSVFSFISTYTSYLVFILMVLLYLILIVQMNKVKRILFSSALALGIVNFTMTGSRGPFFVFLFQATLFVIFFLVFENRIKHKFMVRGGAIAALVCCAFLYTQTGRDSAAAFMGRVSGTEDVETRLVDNYTPFKFLDEAGLIGYGIGTTYQGAAALEENWADMPRDFEQEWERLILELGLTGFLLIMILRIHLLIFSWKSFRRSTIYENRFLLATVFISQIPTVAGLSSVVFNYMDNIFYWFWAGLIVSLNRFEKDSVEKELVPVRAA